MVPCWIARSIPRSAQADPKRFWSPTASTMGSSWILGWLGVGIGSLRTHHLVLRTILVLCTINVLHTISQPERRGSPLGQARGRRSGRARRPDQGTSPAAPEGRPPRGRDDFDLVWARPQRPPRGRARGLSREQVVGAAIAIADREGLEALTMRRVAEQL